MAKSDTETGDVPDQWLDTVIECGQYTQSFKRMALELRRRRTDDLDVDDVTVLEKLSYAIPHRYDNPAQRVIRRIVAIAKENHHE